MIPFTGHSGKGQTIKMENRLELAKVWGLVEVLTKKGIFGVRDLFYIYISSCFHIFISITVLIHLTKAITILF